ncbi:hypothetical protein AB1Y20_014684 [Prymnesium parvum]|uniref:TIR domain-containing protein n=1 Tax=Prymnesium parvum TaxID=97485 RepID=A0AB34IEV8_PRYPA
MAGLRTFAILLLPHVGARVAHRSTSEAASPPTLPPTAGVCADPPAAFEPLLLPYTVIWGTECVDALVLSSEWLEPFRSSGGMASVCNSSVRDWLAATAAFSDLLLWSPSSWSSPVGEEQRIAYICPATCARAGVYVGGCEPPAPLVYEEAVHLNHTAVARTGEELRAHVRAASRIGGVEVQLLAGTVLRLNGTSIPIDGVNVTIWSDGGGAVLDADHLSSLFEVRNGGHLRLLALTLTNGLALTSGGCVSVSGGSAVIRGCTLLNSSALSGGALSVTNGRLQVVDSTLSACSAAWGGALAVNGEHSSAELSSSVVASTVSLRVGGAIFSSGGVTTVDGSTIAYCSSVINGGSLYVFSGGSFVTFTNNSTITHSSTIWGSGGVALMWTNTESVITFENATSIRYTRTGEAGALLLLNGVIRLLSGSIIENSTARTYGGHVYMWGGSFIAEDATLRGGSAESGGCIYLFASHSSSLVRLRDTVAEHHTASIHGGLIYVSGGDSLVEFVDSTLVHSSAAQDGGTIWMSSGIMVATATSILQSSAGQSGGVLTISGGTALISSGSKLLGSNAFRYGGAVSISGGSVTLNSSQIRDSSTSDDGGAIASTGGLVLVTKSIISDSFCEWLGAAFRMRGGVVNVKNSKITRSTGSWGGAVSIAGGTMTISDNSLVVDSIATLHGGTFHITGGTVQVMGDSAIVNSTSNERGGLIYMSAGTIRITSSLVEQCKSNSREGSVLYARSEDFGGLDTLVVFTFVHLVQCEGPLLVGGTSEQVVLRRLTFSAPQQCVLPASLVNEKQCGETFVNFETNEEESVCDSTLPGACTTTLVPGTTLHSHSCDCPWPEIIDDTFGDPLLAPYTKSGCIQPLALSGISVISTRVVVALTKPTPKTQSLNVTLHIVGTDVSRVVNWTVSPPQTNRSWFHFPFEQGQVAASTLSDGGIDVPVPLVLSAHNLQEQATPYEQRVPISVFSEIAGVSRTMHLEILLSMEDVDAGQVIFSQRSRSHAFRAHRLELAAWMERAEEKRYFLRTSLDVECHTPAHDDILTVAYVLIALWPIGSVMLFAVLAYRARLRLKLRVYDKFVHSIRFLHGDFKPDFYYWASVELAQRCALTGWILLVDAEYSFYRVALAQAIALVMLAMSMMLQPYRNQEDNLFLSASKGLLVIAYTCCSYIKVIDDVKEASDEEVASIVFGYTSPDPVIVILVITASLVAFILLCAVFHRAKVERGMQLLRLQDDSLPELMLLPGQRWMLFLSHVWSTGQDQVATIKRQLQRMLPGITIFLDVDDLTDLGQLEQYVHESCSILLFISSGYFLSRNCQREITATLKKSKPRIHVFEPHPGKGVAHSRTLPAENVLQSYTLNSSASNNGLFHGIE